MGGDSSLQQQAPPSPKGHFGATRPGIVPAQAGHEIQRRQQVSQNGPKHEAAVADKKCLGYGTGLLVRGGLDWLGGGDGGRGVYADGQPDNRLEMAPKSRAKKTCAGLFSKIVSHENLLLASQKAKKGKGPKPYIRKFEANLQNELFKLGWELRTGIYQPGALTTFTVRDPKTRKISASPFRDRVVHHAIINVIGPIFESRFIHDTYANRIGKGTKGALERFTRFMRKVSGNGRLAPGARNNNHVVGYALKADIYHYFESVDHQVLLSILAGRIRDKEALRLVQLILANHKTMTAGKGMPLGNLTSQVLANIYLSELDNFIKHELHVHFYIRYVDDFIILSRSKAELAGHWQAIENFLTSHLKLALHPQKTRIVPLSSGLTLLGFRQFYHFRLLKSSNQGRIGARICKFKEQVSNGSLTDEQMRQRFAGWDGYARMANTFRLRLKLKGDLFGAT